MGLSKAHHPLTDLLQSHISKTDEHRAYLAAVAIFLVAARLDSLLKNECR